MKMRVRNSVALIHEPYSIRVPFLALGKPDQTADTKNMHREFFVELAPPINLDARNDEHMTRLAGLDRENGKDTVIRPHKAAGRTAAENLDKN